MHNVQFEITKPTDEATFEDMCARIYGTTFKDPTPQTNGRRGQAQGGIDVFIDAPDGRIGIQCKKYADGALKLKHVEHEISEADNANAPIVRLIIATTATSDARLLREVQDISDRREAAGKFPVEIEFWQDLCRHIRGSAKLQNDYAPNAPGAIFHRLEEHQTELRSRVLSIDSKLDAMTALPHGRPDSVNKYITTQLDGVNELLTAARFKDARESLTRIGADMTLLDSHQQARWHVQRGVCTWHLENSRDAAPDFLTAAELFPDDEKISAAKIRGLLFLDRVDDALDAGLTAHKRFPTSEPVWIALANTRIAKGHAVSLRDAPAEIQNSSGVLQMAAWARRKAGDLAGAVELSGKALERADADFFVRDTALAIALEYSARDPVSVANGLVDERAINSLKSAIEALSPRQDTVWKVQSPETVQNTLVHLGYSYLVVGEPKEALTLVDEAIRAGVLCPRLQRVALEAYSRLQNSDALLQFGKLWLDELEKEALILVAESASDVGDVGLVEDAQAFIEKKTEETDEARHLVRALRWIALWQSKAGRKQALDEICAEDLANAESLSLICGGARILHKEGKETLADAAIEKASSLVSRDTEPAERLLLADLLFATHKWEHASRQYEILAARGKHSELHNRLLHCYLKTSSLRKAKKLLESFPEAWTTDERALTLAIGLGQQASDWEFLLPLSEAHCSQRPEDAGGWLLQLTILLKMRRMARFHEVLTQISLQLSGPSRIIAQLASLEIHFDSKDKGIRRLYAMYRQNIEDVEYASAFFIALVGGPTDLPFMEEFVLEMSPGTAATLEDEFGEQVIFTLDPEGLSDFPIHDGFFAPDSDIAGYLLGASVGQEIVFPGRFGREQRFIVKNLTSAFRRLLQLAQDKVKSPAYSNLPLMSLPIPETDTGADFSHVHSMLKHQSDHAQRAFEAYEHNPITLGILANLIGRNVVDIISDWPFNSATLFVYPGTSAQLQEALNLLSDKNENYVIDAATIVELAFLDCLEALEILPNLFIATNSYEILEARLEESQLEAASGRLFDDNGTMRFVEHTEEDRKRQISYLQKMVDAAQKNCSIVPAYGPEEVPFELKHLKEFIPADEFSTLLLSTEKDATLFTVDGRLAQLGRSVVGLKSVWPQVVCRQAMSQEKLAPRKYQLAILRAFIRNRNFVSLGPHDVVYMCLQGGDVMCEGLQKFKKYLYLNTDIASALALGFGFLELQTRYPTQFRAFRELLEHVIEALLLHPHSNRIGIIARSREFAWKCAHLDSGYFLALANVEGERQRRLNLRERLLNESIDSAVRYADHPKNRPVRLRVIMCMRSPFLVFDDDASSLEDSAIED